MLGRRIVLKSVEEDPKNVDCHPSVARALASLRARPLDSPKCRRRRIKNLTDGSEKPLGEWNEMIIECRGDAISIWVNGELVNAGTKCTAREGKIAIQAEGARCEFRRVVLERL